MAGSCDQSNESARFIKVGNFLPSWITITSSIPASVIELLLKFRKSKLYDPIRYKWPFSFASSWVSWYHYSSVVALRKFACACACALRLARHPNANTLNRKLPNRIEHEKTKPQRILDSFPNILQNKEQWKTLSFNFNVSLQLQFTTRRKIHSRLY
jgi:hypothetical protein